MSSIKHMNFSLSALRIRKGYSGEALVVLFMVLLTGGSAYGARVQFVNASEDFVNLTTIDIYVDGVKTVPSLMQFAATEPIEIAGGTYDFAVALGGSQLVGEAFFTQSISVGADSLYTFFYYGLKESVTNPFDLFVDGNTRYVSLDTDKADISFVHLANGAEAVDIVLRSGPMIAGGVGFRSASDYQALDGEDLYLDFKRTGTTDIISTYRLSLQPYVGQAMKVFAVGSLANSNSFRQWLILSDGFVVPVDFSPIARVQLINTFSQAIDVYKNGTRFSNNTLTGGAMPFKYIPAGIVMNIAICDSSSINAQTSIDVSQFTFDNMVTYTAVASGATSDVQMYLHSGSKEAATDTNVVSLLFFNGDYTKSTLKVTEPLLGSTLFTQIPHGGFGGYVDVLPNVHNFELRDIATGSEVNSFLGVDLAPLKGKVATLVTAPDPDNTSRTKMWLITAEGQSQELTPTVGTYEDDAPDYTLSLSPNPVYDLLTITSKGDIPETEKLQYQILDTRGTVLLNGVLQSEYQDIDVHRLPPGLYIINFQNESTFHYNLKFVK
jgi:Domain of unknown function (DUF4397)/Secretion system C-terminal sorting domain